VEIFGAEFCQLWSRNMKAASMNIDLDLCVKGRTVIATRFLQTYASPAISFKEGL
jgi:hypothetical protein